MIAKLAESRKAKKSIYSFGPVAAISAPVKASVPSFTSSSGNPDLLGSILASQSQLSTFGKSTEAIRPKPKNSSNRVLGAILASQATLSRLDETIRLMEQSSEPQTSTICTKLNLSTPERTAKNCSNRQSDATDKNSNTSTNHQCSSERSSNGNDHSADQSHNQTSGETSGNGISNSNGGSGDGNDDPNHNKKKKKDPDDKKDDNTDEEDVDLYSDIESVEENNSPEELPKNEVIILILTRKKVLSNKLIIF